MSAAEPTISIIVAAYNAEGLIGGCLDSCLAQTYGAFEVIVIDDGSTDGTPGILQAYARKDARLRFDRVKNGGQGKARNIALGHATGDYITVLDADDALHETALEQLVRPITDKERNAAPDIVVGEWTTVDTETGAHRYTPIFANCLPAMPVDQIKTRLIRNTYYSVAKLYRRTLIEETQIRFGEGYIYEDMEFLIGAVLNAATIAVVSQPVYTVYASTETSTKTQTDSTWHADSFIKAVCATTDTYGEALQVFRPQYVHYTLNRAYFYTAVQGRIPRRLWKTFVDDIFQCLNKLFATSPTRDTAGTKFYLALRLWRLHSGVGYYAFCLINKLARLRLRLQHP